MPHAVPAISTLSSGSVGSPKPLELSGLPALTIGDLGKELAVFGRIFIDCRISFLQLRYSFVL